MTRATLFKLVLLFLLAMSIAAAYASGLADTVSLQSIQDNKSLLQDSIAESPLQASGLLFLVYVVVTALSLPGAAVMTLLAGALFPFWIALGLVSFASSLGATLAFLMSRFILRDWVKAHWGEKIKAIDRGIKEEGSFYLFALRLVPLFPFFLVNSLMGLTPMRTLTFYLVSQVGMLPGTAVYVFAGRELGAISSLSDIASPTLLLAFTLLGVTPLALRKLVLYLRRRGAPHAKI